MIIQGKDAIKFKKQLANNKTKLADKKYVQDILINAKKLELIMGTDE